MGETKGAEDFYGVELRKIHVDGLETEIRHSERKALDGKRKKYAYIVYLDGRGIKWKIIPTITGKGKIHVLKLYHRSAHSGGFHIQSQGAWGTTKGLTELVQEIRAHEVYERTRNTEEAAWPGRGAYLLPF